MFHIPLCTLLALIIQDKYRMRDLIDLLNQKPPSTRKANMLAILDETYSRNNNYLLQYMKNNEFDPYDCWWEVCDWLEERGYLEEISQILGHPVESASDLNEEEPDVFYKLPDDIRERCGEEIIEQMMRYNPAEAPTRAHLDLRDNKLLPRGTWLVHFSNAANMIWREGFTRGVDQMDKLGLTTWFDNDGFNKKYGGYNFAFTAQSRYAENAALNKKYGNEAVLFQNSGVKGYHYSDEEEQVIFWGADIRPGSLVYLRHESNNWIVTANRDTKRGDRNLFQGDYENAVQWVIKNYDQYRKYLSWHEFPKSPE
jgi:hypothetical protein